MPRSKRGFLTERVREFERRCLIRILRRTKGNVSEAARLAGRDRVQVYRMATIYGIDLRQYRPPPEPDTSSEAGGVEGRGEGQQCAGSPVAQPAEKKHWFGVPIAPE